MIQMKSHFITFINGQARPGGMHCGCCAPRTGKDRKKWYRLGKRKYKQLMRKHIQEFLDDA